MKYIHFIGICGVGMSALSILWKKKGWKVTGSDAGFFPPISTHLKKNNIEYYPGWHPEKIGTPDIVVVGNVAGSENPEWVYVQKNKIPFISYPELIAQNLIKENSIVCAGTYGKTSSTVLLSWILKESGYNPTYMFGGLSLNLPESADDPENSKWSVIEGDEYKTARWNDKAKFFSYKPTHLLLSSIEWDHADIYPTEELYFTAFEKLIKMLPKDGLVVACTDNKNVEKIVTLPCLPAGRSHCHIVTYGQKDCDYIYIEVKQTNNELTFNIYNNSNTYEISVPIIGEYMAENICGAFAMAMEIGIAPEKIIEALKNFKGIKRRLEKRGKINGADVFDDIAHSPTKAKSVLETLSKIYSGDIYAIFEPNTGNREPVSFPQYDNAFEKAKTLIIPRLTKLKTRPHEKKIDGEELTKIISKTHNNTKYFKEDADLINFLKKNVKPKDVVVFLGSHSFRGMIENLILFV